MSLRFEFAEHYKLHGATNLVFAIAIFTLSLCGGLAHVDRHGPELFKSDSSVDWITHR